MIIVKNSVIVLLKMVIIVEKLFLLIVIVIINCNLAALNTFNAHCLYLFFLIHTVVVY